MKREIINIKKDKNVYVCGFSNFEKYQVAEYNNIHINIPGRDTRRLENFIIQEGTYYNSILEVISPIIRTSKDDFKIVMEKYYDLLKTVSIHGFKIVPCMYNQIELPDYMKKFESLLYGKDDNGDRIFPKRLAFLIDSAAGPGNIISGVRVNIITEIFKHTLEQIKKLENVVDDGKDEIVYKKAAEMLEPIDVYYRNSIQLTKDCMKIEYDFENECTKIYTQYTYDPIIIPKINLVKNSHWNLLLIKFNYDKNNKREWSVSTRKIGADYMVKASTYSRKKMR